MCIRDFFSYQKDSQFREDFLKRFLVERGKGDYFFPFTLPFIVEKQLGCNIVVMKDVIKLFF